MCYAEMGGVPLPWTWCSERAMSRGACYRACFRSAMYTAQLPENKGPIDVLSRVGLYSAMSFVYSDVKRGDKLCLC